MGRNNKKKYAKDLHQQAYEKLKGMIALGESKAAAKKIGAERDKIYSFATYQTYWKHIKYFLRWVKKVHPECTTLKAAKRHVNEWLQLRVEQGKSNWTVATEAAALNKLFGIEKSDPKRFQPPKRRREDIKRSRVDTVRDKHFSVTNNDLLIKFVRATGTRRNVLKKLRGKDLWSRERMEQTVSELENRNDLSERETSHLAVLKDALETFPDQTWYLHHKKDKNGRYRMAPVVGPYTGLVVERMQNTPPEELVFLHVNSNADIHSYRADYAAAIYRRYARKIEEIPFDATNQGTGRRYQKDVYRCKMDEKGKKLDRAAMYRASKALGHNRISIISDHYLYKL